jgi:hypothetical protein
MTRTVPTADAGMRGTAHGDVVDVPAVVGLLERHASVQVVSEPAHLAYCRRRKAQTHP